MSGQGFNLCIIKPNASVYSETFIQNHIDNLAGNIFVLHGGAFPVYQQNGSYLIQSKLDLLIYLFQKRILKKSNIEVRNKALVKYLKGNKIDVVLAEYGMVGAAVCKACKQVPQPRAPAPLAPEPIVPPPSIPEPEPAPPVVPKGKL